MADPLGNTVVTPDFTDTVNQEFFIEAVGGPKNPRSYLDNFTENIYTHDVNSNLVALLYALLGPAGVGTVRKNHLLARLIIEESGLKSVDLDNLYGNPFSFARLASESYEFIPSGLLTNAQWERIQMADASYRNRAIDFFKATRAGGTQQGLTLAAKSGLNRGVDIIENYRALFDHYSDNPLGLTQYGSTQSTEEVVILPRQEIPKSNQQIVSLSKTAVKGHFRLLLPIGNIANSESADIPFDASFADLQKILEEVKVIGPHNVVVQGGPISDQPFVISFTGDLADRPLPFFIIENGNVTLENVEGETLFPRVETQQVGVSADSEPTPISAEDFFYANFAVERIKPVTTIVTPGKAPSITRRQIINNHHSDSTFTEVLRYVTGLTSVDWPEPDGTNWIEGGKENEAPVPLDGQQHHYVNFHAISSATAYTDEALADPNYEIDTTVLARYDNEHLGSGFSIYEKTLYPFLSAYSSFEQKLLSSYAIAVPTDPLTIQAVVNETPLIKKRYPVGYISIAGSAYNPKGSAQTYFWSSLERASGIDYLEIDLGSVQAVNFLSFQASNKPYDIGLSYDKVGLSSERTFIPVTLSASTTTHLGFDASARNPWKNCEMHFENSLGNIIFTRYLRLEFAKRTGSPFVLENGTLIPYSIQVKSLRAGRNLS